MRYLNVLKIIVSHIRWPICFEINFDFDTPCFGLVRRCLVSLATLLIALRTGRTTDDTTKIWSAETDGWFLLFFSVPFNLSELVISRRPDLVNHSLWKCEKPLAPSWTERSHAIWATLEVFKFRRGSTVTTDEVRSNIPNIPKFVTDWWTILKPFYYLDIEYNLLPLKIGACPYSIEPRYIAL